MSHQGLPMPQFESLVRPRLNFDVLRLVCHSLTDVSDVLRFALTCSALTEGAFQRRLRMSPIDLSNDQFVGSFHRFIFANDAARAPYIYGLKLLDMSRLRREDSTSSRLRTAHGQLVAILEVAVHLEYIYFPTTLDLDPVLAATANMTSLRELRIVFAAFGSDSKWSPWKLLSSFRSPLRSLRIDSTYDSADEAFSVELIHDHLANFAPTLQVLEVHSIDFDDSPSSVTTQFTALRSFTTHSVLNWNESTMEVLLRLFPNLDETLALGYLGVMDMEHSHEDLRERSMEIQKTRPWSGLDRVVCDARLAFLMVLQCPVRQMHITVLRFYGRGLLGTILRNNCPQLLHLSLLFNNSLRDLDDLFPGSEEVAPLTHLIVFIAVEVREGRHGEPTSIPWDQFRDKLLESVTHLQLTHLRVVFHYTVWHQATQDASAIQEQDAMYTAGPADLDTVATRTFDAMPTIRNVLLTTCGHTYRSVPRHEARPGVRKTLNRWHASKAWRAADSVAEDHRQDLVNAKASPVALSREGSEKIIAQEDLHLSRDEEEMVRRCGDIKGRRD